jgi:hypothetical protein
LQAGNGSKEAELSGLRAVGKRKDAGGAASCGGRGGAARLADGLGRDSGFGLRSGLCRSGGGVDGGARMGLFLDAHEVLIGDFPAKMLVLAVLLEILLEKDGAAGIGDKYAGSRQEDIAGAILHLHTAAQEG